MIRPRLASSVLVSSLLRRAEAEGGFGTILAKGDQTAGAVIVILLERGRNCLALERVLDVEGHYVWRPFATSPVEPRAQEARLARRRQIDPDLWIVELDIASAERFAAEMNEVG